MTTKLSPSDRIAMAAILVSVLSGILWFYGEFQKNAQRLDRNEQDVQEIKVELKDFRAEWKSRL